MYRWPVVMVMVVGCGRIGFDPMGASGDAGADAQLATVERLPCDMPVLLDAGGDLPQDGVAWISAPSGDWLVESQHVACDNHPIERYSLQLSANQVVARDTGSILQTTHAHGLAFATTPDGYVMGYTEVNDSTAHTAHLGPDLVVTATHALGVLSAGNPPLARAGGGGLAMIGLQAGAAVVLGIDDTGTPTTSTTTVAPAAEGPNLPTMISIDSGLAAVWQSDVGSRCRVALLRPDLSLASGPVSVPITGCTAAQIAWVTPARRFVIVAQDPGDGAIYGAVLDDTLALVAGPFVVAPGAISPQIVADTTGTWVGWADSSTFALGHARVGVDGSVKAQPAAGQIDTTLPHYEIVQLVGGYGVAIWLDTAQTRSLAAMRFCAGG